MSICLRPIHYWKSFENETYGIRQRDNLKNRFVRTNRTCTSVPSSSIFIISALGPVKPTISTDTVNNGTKKVFFLVKNQAGRVETTRCQRAPLSQKRITLNARYSRGTESPYEFPRESGMHHRRNNFRFFISTPNRISLASSSDIFPEYRGQGGQYSFSSINNFEQFQQTSLLLSNNRLN